MKSKNRWHSFVCAVNGLVYTLRTQRNTWIELSATVVVIIAGVWLHIRPVEWALLALTVGLILALEAVNSAIEALVNLVSPEYHELARDRQGLCSRRHALRCAWRIGGGRIDLWSSVMGFDCQLGVQAAARSAGSPSTTKRKWWGRTLPELRS